MIEQILAELERKSEKINDTLWYVNPKNIMAALERVEEGIANKYGDFKDSRTGEDLRFYLLPHTKHTP